MKFCKENNNNNYFLGKAAGKRTLKSHAVPSLHLPSQKKVTANQLRRRERAQTKKEKAAIFTASLNEQMNLDESFGTVEEVFNDGKQFQH